MNEIDTILALLPERIASKLHVEPMTGCMLWTGARSRGGRSGGYGSVRHNGSSRQVHRVVWEILFGALPDRITLDHVRARGCASKLCCAPWHLEPVSISENNRRSTCWKHDAFQERIRRKAA